MLSENLKNLRKAKGLSQNDLAIKLNVVRQTVSKWEKGLSVPDSEMLIHIANALDTSVNVLLNETVKPDDNSEIRAIAEKLETINRQIEKQNESRRKMRRFISITAFIISVCILLCALISYISFVNNIATDVAIIGGADGPTSILISNTAYRHYPVVITLIIAVISAIGIYKTRKQG